MKNLRVDIILLMAILVLTTFGIVVIYSSSSHYALIKHNDPSYLVVRHSGKAIFGVIGLFIAMSINPNFWRSISRYVFWVGVVLCLIVLFKISGLTMSAKGATRWISIVGFSFQPAEIVKIGLIMLLARNLEKNQEWLSDFKTGFLPNIILVGFVFTIIFFQPNYSMSLMIAGIALMLVFVAGCNVKHIGFLVLGSIPLFAILAMSSEYRRKRIFSMLDPENNVNSSHQQIQALTSLGNGGFNGVGLGEGTQKLGYLPEPFTDSIYATIGEELGFIGTFSIMLLFAIIIWRGLHIAFHAKEMFVKLLALGITMGIALNVLLHVAVCLKVAPPTGQPLPLVSHGGTSLIMTLGALGILLSLSKKDDSKTSTFSSGAVL